MAYKFNPFTGTLDDVGSGGGGSTSPGGSNTQVQFNDGGAFGGDSGLTFNKTTNLLTVGASTGDGGQAKVFGDINLDDGGSFTTTVQCVTPTANRTISFPNATGTVALVAGSSGQLLWNNAGANAGVTGSVADSSGNVTLGGLTTLSGSPTANGTSSLIQSNVAVTGAWRTGASSNNPALLLNPTGTTPSTTWSTSGTGIGVNAPASYAGNLLDLQVNGTSRFSVSSSGALATASTLTITGVLYLYNVGGTSAGLSPTNGNEISILLNNIINYQFNTEGLVSGSARYIGFSSSSTLAAGAAADVRLFRDAANTLAQRNGTNAQTFRVYNTYTSGTNYELGKLEWSSNVFRIGTEKGSGGGTARSLELQTDGVTRWTISASSGTLSAGTNASVYLENGGIGRVNYSYISFPAVDGNILLNNWNANGFGRLQFGGTTSSFPALKRNAAALETKLADDSAYAQHAASVFQTATAHTVATLPGTPAVGMIARVTDATSPTVGSTVTGGGAAAALVWYNGANWSVIGV